MDEVLFEVAGSVGLVTLNRPQALNALTLAMVRALDAQLRAWSSDPKVRCVVIRGAGERAFCAGGDIRALYDSGKSKFGTLTADFYREEYRLNRLIKHYPKPYIALIDGVVMGGGVGVSIHGSHRIATERTLFAMPETGIGLFPDVGGSYFLPRCPGRIGFYLGLTGARIRAADCLYAGIATHHVPFGNLDTLIDALRQTPDGDVTDTVSRFAASPGTPSLAQNRAAIDHCFSAASVETIQAALEADGSEWAKGAHAAMGEKAPICEKVTLRQLERGSTMTFEDCMVMEFRLSQRAMAAHDFYEGVRAAVIDKDRAPKWRPAALTEVSEADVDVWFTPLPGGDLDFP
jgi:enoyl-CoA hydratase